MHGSQNLDSSLLHADMGFTLDTHGHPGVMSYKAPGKNQIHIHIAGKAAHAGVEPEKGINAIVAAGTLLADAPQGRIDVETTCNVGRIAGGSATNVVADSCDVYYESRSRDKKKLEEITQRIVDHFKAKKLPAAISRQKSARTMVRTRFRRMRRPSKLLRAQRKNWAFRWSLRSRAAVRMPIISIRMACRLSYSA